MPNPLAEHVLQMKASGVKYPRVELKRRFEEQGWESSEAIIYLWCTDRRWPTLESQTHIDVVTGGAVKPEHWTAYGIERLESGAKRPAPYGKKKRRTAGRRRRAG